MKVIPGNITIVIVIGISIFYAGSELQKSQFPSRPGGATWGRQIPIKVSLSDESEIHPEMYIFFIILVCYQIIKPPQT